MTGPDQDRQSQAEAPGLGPLGGVGWDCHIHVFGDPGRFPFAEERRYTPPVAGPEAASAFLDGLSARFAVLQQASVYGSDNACLLWALERLAGRAVGVIQVPARVPSTAELERLTRLGVRGIRLHLADCKIEGLTETVHRYAGPGWHLDVHAISAPLEALERLIADVTLPVALDHFGGLAPGRDGSIPPLLGRWLDSGTVWLKLSAPYRVAGLPPARVAAYVAALVERWPERCLWGSDWPHTPLHPASDAERVSPKPFRQIDTAALAWSALSGLTSAQRQAVLCTAPASLYGAL